MSKINKSLKSKLVSEDINDFLNESQFVKQSPRTKKPQKRQRTDTVEGITSTIEHHPLSSKNKKFDGNFDTCGDTKRKLYNVINRQLESRKQINEGLLKNLSDVLNSLEADHNALKENQEKLEHLTGAFMKCIQQTATAHKQKLKTLKDIYTSFQKDTEGLLKRGAIKPDDRPLWFDVYKAFPPITEPKFARPKVEDKNIRPILYKEDVLRAKFHATGHGLTINMQNPSGETHIKRLMKQYEKLKDEGVPENELIERAALATNSERQQQKEVQDGTPKKVEAATPKVLSEANIENIFKE